MSDEANRRLAEHLAEQSMRSRDIQMPGVMNDAERRQGIPEMERLLGMRQASPTGESPGGERPAQHFVPEDVMPKDDVGGYRRRRLPPPPPPPIGPDYRRKILEKMMYGPVPFREGRNIIPASVFESWNVPQMGDPAIGVPYFKLKPEEINYLESQVTDSRTREQFLRGFGPDAQEALRELWQLPDPMMEGPAPEPEVAALQQRRSEYNDRIEQQTEAARLAREKRYQQKKAQAATTAVAGK
jgi:hypothetical protein